jgi:hypothetical protein
MNDRGCWTLGARWSDGASPLRVTQSYSRSEPFVGFVAFGDSSSYWRPQPYREAALAGGIDAFWASFTGPDGAVDLEFSEVATMGRHE